MCGARRVRNTELLHLSRAPRHLRGVLQGGAGGGAGGGRVSAWRPGVQAFGSRCPMSRSLPRLWLAPPACGVLAWVSLSPPPSGRPQLAQPYAASADCDFPGGPVPCPQVRSLAEPRVASGPSPACSFAVGRPQAAVGHARKAVSFPTPAALFVSSAGLGPRVPVMGNHGGCLLLCPPAQRFTGLQPGCPTAGQAGCERGPRQVVNVLRRRGGRRPGPA